ncbi:ABC transporter permease [Cohaesibacter celericrescens]|uniref:ABC transporter permease n=1 Tax=Cohaesibacter celericrescens TaxID=2067669 RepID=A0A2N5XK90_9HYPH|nr:ABC transporter permease [Cohaesibacter celericrescens]PLW74847.1 ABC transporter permease [Cohaesibacter celericrescens]
MLRFVLMRLASALPTLLGMSFVAFAIVALAPGDPITQELRTFGVVPTPEDLAALKAQYGLDKPFFERYFLWLLRALQFDFGDSIASGRPVMTEIGLHLPATLLLSLTSLAGAIGLSLFFGIAAVSTATVAAGLLRALTILLVSVPSFWLALVLIYVFVLNLGWARLVGDGRWHDLILPALTLSLGAGATLGRVVRERIRSEMCQDYVRLAIAKGVPPSTILVRHITPQIIGPLATAWASTFGALLGGAVIVESIFGWPGLGQLILQAIGQRDYPVIQAYLILGGLIFFITSFIADFVVTLADPQLKRKLRHGR